MIFLMFYLKSLQLNELTENANSFINHYGHIILKENYEIMKKSTISITHQKKYFVTIALILLLLSGTIWFSDILNLNGLAKTNAVSSAGVNSDQNNASNIEKYSGSNTDSGVPILTGLSRVNQKDIGRSSPNQDIKSIIETPNREIDQDYKKYLLEYDGPISDIFPDLVKLAKQGDGDVSFRLIDFAMGFCTLKEKDDSHCPDGLEKYVVEKSSLYHVVRSLAKSGSLMAMANLQFYIPPPFKNRKDFINNVILRSRNPEIVTDYYVSVRRYLDIATQKGSPLAMLRMADLYISGNGIVDPNRNTAAFWMLSWSEITGKPISNFTHEMFLDPIDYDSLKNLEKRAENYAKQFD